MFNKEKRQQAKANKEYVKSQFHARPTFAQTQEKKNKQKQARTAAEAKHELAADHLRALHAGGDVADVTQLGADLLYLDALSGLQFKIEDQFSAERQICTRWTVYGRHDSDFMGLAPTGKEVAIGGMSISLIREKRISQNFHFWDVTSLLLQIQDA